MAYQHLFRKNGRFAYLHKREGTHGGMHYWFSYNGTDVPDQVIDIPEGYIVIENSEGWPVLKRKPANYQQ